MKSNWVKLLASAACLAAGSLVYVNYPAPPAELPPERVAGPGAAGRLVCSGRVEAVTGEIDVAAILAGRLSEVRAREGEYVEKGAILAVVDDARQAAEQDVAEKDVRRARANLERLLAGTGAEEVAEALAAANAAEAELRYEEKGRERARRLTG